MKIKYYCLYRFVPLLLLDFKNYAGRGNTEEFAALEEEPHLSPTFMTTFNSLQPCSPGSHLDSLVQGKNDYIDGINDDAVATPVHMSPEMSPRCSGESNEEEEDGGEFSDGKTSLHYKIMLCKSYCFRCFKLCFYFYCLSELNVKTPAFIRQRKNIATPGAIATPTVLKDVNAR